MDWDGLVQMESAPDFLVACMTGALRAKRGERDISRGARSARRGEEKNKAPVRSPLFLLFRPLSPTNKTNRCDVKRTNQKTRFIIARNLSSFWRDASTLQWLRELLPKFTDLNHLNFYIDFAKSLSYKIRVQFQFFP